MTATLRIGVTDYFQPPFDIEKSHLGGGYELVSLDLAEGTLPATETLESLDALLVWHATINTQLAKKLTKARIVVRYGVGFDNIDISALTARAIVFCNTPDYGVDEVADTATAMILGLHRRIVEYDHLCRFYDGGWQEHILSPLKRAATTTVGIFGVGRIGGAVVRRLRAFDYDIVGYDPYQPAGHEKSLGYRRADSIAEMLAQCDIVTMHCPLSEETRGIVNASFLAMMRHGAIFVNTARGGLVDNLDCLYAALTSGQLAAIGLDVLPDEPPRSGKLIDAWKDRRPEVAGRLLINPHTAYYSEQAYAEMRQKAAETIKLFFERGIVRNRIGALKEASRAIA